MRKLIFAAQRHATGEHVWWDKQWCDIPLIDYAVRRTRPLHTVVDISDERRWPNTDATSVLTKAADLAYITELQGRFDDIKDKTFEKFAGFAANSERVGMRFYGLEMSRPDVDMLILQMMATKQ